MRSRALCGRLPAVLAGVGQILRVSTGVAAVSTGRGRWGVAGFRAWLLDSPVGRTPGVLWGFVGPAEVVLAGLVAPGAWWPGALERVLDPGDVLLFGSAARGEQVAGSDLDLVFDPLGGCAGRQRLTEAAREAVRDAVGAGCGVRVAGRPEWRARTKR